MKIQKYDIFYFPMEYQEDFMQDHPRFKYRPCVVKDISDNTIVIMSMVTSKQHKNQYKLIG